MSKLGDALKGLVDAKGWGEFPKELLADIKSFDGVSPGMTLQRKNEYRMRVVALCAVGAVAGLTLHWAVALALGGIGLWKIKIILTDN